MRWIAAVPVEDIAPDQNWFYSAGFGGVAAAAVGAVAAWSIVTTSRTSAKSRLHQDASRDALRRCWERFEWLAGNDGLSIPLRAAIILIGQDDAFAAGDARLSGVLMRYAEHLARCAAGGGSDRRLADEFRALDPDTYARTLRELAEVGRRHVKVAGGPMPPTLRGILEPRHGSPPQARHRKAAERSPQTPPWIPTRASAEQQRRADAERRRHVPPAPPGTPRGRTTRTGPTGEPSLIRPYIVTGGRTESSIDLPSEATIETRESARRPRWRPDDVRGEIVSLCVTRPSVPQIAAHLRLPLGVARVLVGDLVTSGHLQVHGSTQFPQSV